MDTTALIREIGGGLGAVVIVMSWIVIGVLYRRTLQLSDKLVEMSVTLSKENRDLLSVTNSTIHAASETTREAIRRMEARG